MRKKTVLITSTILIMILCFTSSVNAYTFTGQRWPKVIGSTYTIYVKYATSNANYRAAFDSAVSDWNNAQDKIQFSLSSLHVSTLSTVGVQNVDDPSLFGSCTWHWVPGTNTISYFQAVLNTYNSDIVNKTKTRRSTAGHELGHALGLGHVDPPYNAIMNSSRNRETLYTPQKDDIDGVKALYAL